MIDSISNSDRSIDVIEAISTNDSSLRDRSVCAAWCVWAVTTNWRSTRLRSSPVIRRGVAWRGVAWNLPLPLHTTTIRERQAGCHQLVARTASPCIIEAALAAAGRPGPDLGLDLDAYWTTSHPLAALNTRSVRPLAHCGARRL